MSVSGLSNTIIKVMSPITSQDGYAADQAQWYTKIGEFRCRVRLLNPKLESFINGKESSYPLYRFYPPTQLNIIDSDLIYDVVHDLYYDVVAVNTLDERSMMQIDCKLVDDATGIIEFLSSSSSSSSYVNNWSSSSSSSLSSSSSSSESIP